MIALLLVAASAFVQPDLDRLSLQLQLETQESITLLGKGFKYANPPKRQVLLLQDDLRWQRRGYSERQVRLVSILALYKAVGNAEQLAAQLLEVDEDERTQEQQRKLNRLESFILTGAAYVDYEAEKLKDMRKDELTFYVSTT